MNSVDKIALATAAVVMHVRELTAQREQSELTGEVVRMLNVRFVALAGMPGFGLNEPGTVLAYGPEVVAEMTVADVAAAVAVVWVAWRRAKDAEQLEAAAAFGRTHATS